VSDLTLEDVARQAGVSRSTVSRVVNDHPNVSENVRRRVLKVIQKDRLPSPRRGQDACLATFLDDRTGSPPSVSSFLQILTSPLNKRYRTGVQSI